MGRGGDAAYSVYMMHFPLFWAIGMAFRRFPRSGPHAAQLHVALLIAAALPASLLVHRFVEAPLTRWLGGRARTMVGARMDGRDFGPGIEGGVAAAAR